MIKTVKIRTSSAIQWLRLSFAPQGVCILPLVRELGTQRLQGMAKKIKSVKSF